jgi:hypothetical protein
MYSRQQKMFCKVCFDTGKPESLYTSHFVNDVPGNKGVVVCPTLLALECRYCKQTGHTVSRCNMIPEARKKQFPRKKGKEPRSIHEGSVVSDTAAAVAMSTQVTPTYASIVVAPPVIPVARIFQPRSPSTSPPPLKKMSWAEYESDSDSD